MRSAGIKTTHIPYVDVHVLYSVLARVSRPWWLSREVCKSVGGGRHEGGGSTIYSFIFERVWLKASSDQRYGGGLHEGAAYTSEYGKCIEVYTMYTPIGPAVNNLMRNMIVIGGAGRESLTRINDNRYSFFYFLV